MTGAPFPWEHPCSRTMMLYNRMMCSFSLNRICHLALLCRTCLHCVGPLPLWLAYTNTLQIFHSGWMLSFPAMQSGVPWLPGSGSREALELTSFHNHKYSCGGRRMHEDTHARTHRHIPYACLYHVCETSWLACTNIYFPNCEAPTCQPRFRPKHRYLSSFILKHCIFLSTEGGWPCINIIMS